MREESVFLNGAVREVKFLQRKTFLECQNKEKITVYDVTTIEKIMNKIAPVVYLEFFRPTHNRKLTYQSDRSLPPIPTLFLGVCTEKFSFKQGEYSIK